jgi:hypothetical protein
MPPTGTCSGGLAPLVSELECGKIAKDSRKESSTENGPVL